MKIDFAQNLVDLDGRPIVLEAHEDGTAKLYATLGNVAKMALMSPKLGLNGQAEPAPGMEALSVFDLALRIHGAEEPVPVTSDEVTRIKDRIAAVFTAPLVVGQAWKMLESLSSN